jgi:hypothetical protein
LPEGGLSFNSGCGHDEFLQRRDDKFHRNKCL